jgi:type I restriction enzyme S subunit
MKNGWQIRKLGDVATLQRGFDLPTQNRVAGEFPLVSSSGISDTHYRRAVQGPGVVTGRSGSIGNVFFIEEDFWPLNTVLYVKDFHGNDPRFLFHLLKKFDLQRFASGSGVPTLNRNFVHDELAGVPPIPEQKRIVGILDEAFEGIAAAKANAGKNLQNARALFESHLHSVFTQRGAEWERVTLETLLGRGWIEDHMDGNHGGDYPRKQEFISKGVPYISANCLDDERIDMSRAKYLSQSRASLLRKGFARDNDVLFAHNATVGPVAILHTEEERVILGTSLTYYRCDPKYILPEYLAHYMRSFEFKSQYLQVMRQSTRNQVPITKQRELYHVIPPLDEQKRVIVALDGLFESGQQLESIYQQKLVALEELKKSLLHQAFTGQL